MSRRYPPSTSLSARTTPEECAPTSTTTPNTSSQRPRALMVKQGAKVGNFLLRMFYQYELPPPRSKEWLGFHRKLRSRLQFPRGNQFPPFCLSLPASDLKHEHDLLLVSKLNDWCQPGSKCSQMQ